MQLHKLNLGDFKTNCYIIADEQTKEAIIFDVPADGESIFALLRKNQYVVKYIVITHSHFDHILALDYVKEVTNAQVLTKNEVAHEEIVKIAGGRMKFFHTPGHTQDSICILVEPDNILFTGDTLFKGTVGRTDLPGGNLESELKSIKKCLMPLDNNIQVYPGHGPSSTIAEERINNPHFN